MMTVIASAGTTLPATIPASVECQDKFGKACKVTFARPALIETYLQAAGRIDLHNRHRQGTLDLEHSWITQKWHFRISTTILGMCLVDAYLALTFGIEPLLGSITVKRFTNELVTTLLRSGVSMHIDSHVQRPRLSDVHRCSIVSFGRRLLCIARDSGIQYDKQIQRYCRVCGRPTSFGCTRCGLGYCSRRNTGRDCWDKNLTNPSLRSSKKRNSFP